MHRPDRRHAWRLLPAIPALVLGLVAAAPATTALAAGAPNITSVTPNTGSGCGGTTVVIGGNGFGTINSVTFGGTAGTIDSVRGNQIVATSPPHAASTTPVDVQVTNGSSKTSPIVPADQFTYTTGVPTMTSIDPSIGPTSGGTGVTITGSCFENVSSVSFGTNPAATYTVLNDTTITATSPAAASAGTVELTVATAAGHVSLAFTYKNPPTAGAPTVTSVSPNSGSTAGGGTVTVTGTGFYGLGSACDVTDVDFGDVEPNPVSPQSCTATSFTITVPPGAGPGTVDVLVTTSDGGTSAINPPADSYTYLVTYFFAWYDRISSPGFVNDNIHVMNPAQPGGSSAHITVHIPGSGCTDQTATIAPQAEQFFSCASGFGGPATVASDTRVIASQRVQFYKSFNELQALPASSAGTDLQFAWYDRVSSPGFVNDNVHVINPGATDSSVSVTIPGCAAQPGVIHAGQAAFFSCATGIGGPADVAVISGPAVLASQRVQYYQSFNEEWGQQPSKAATNLMFSWYDHTSSVGFVNDNIHIWDPSGAALSSSALTVTIPGCSSPSHYQPGSANELVYYCPFGQGYGGPVQIVSTGPKVLASQRVQYFNTFNEVPANDPANAGVLLYFLWYDHISDQGFLHGNDNIHIVNPGGTAATVNILVPGNPACSIVPTTQNVPAGGAQFFNCLTGFGGPVVITSDQPVLASQRVQYYQSFNEVLASQ